MTEQGLPPILRLTIEAKHQLRADIVATIVVRLAEQFSSYQSRVHISQPAVLRIDGIRTGSLISDLIAVADAANTLFSRYGSVREILAGFYQQLFDAYTMWAQVGPSGVSERNRRTIEILAAPVAEDNATQVSVQLFGNNNTVIIITPDTLRDVKKITRRTPDPL